MAKTSSAEVHKSGCCGPVADRIALIRQVSQGLHDGHAGIAALYDSIASDLDDEKEREEFRSLAIRHRAMGVESLTLLVPDGHEEEEEGT